MKVFFIILLTAFQSVLACEVKLPAQVVVFDSGFNGNEFVEGKDCSEETFIDLKHLISTLEGKVASFQLKELMRLKGHGVEILPTSILIVKFHTLLREQVNLPQGIHIQAAKVLETAPLLPLEKEDTIELDCPSCQFGNEQIINITINPRNGKKYALKAMVNFKRMVRALRLTSPLAAFSFISDSESFKEDFVESIPHTDLITDIESLKFFKTNKPLKAGELIKKSDLNPLNLVKAGLRTDVILENQMIRIKTQGISRSSGSFGDYVEVFHPQKNKKYLGKVIDINKVLVEI
jgi:flagella basal body P-ring formation protein FlgA